MNEVASKNFTSQQRPFLNDDVMQRIIIDVIRDIEIARRYQENTYEKMVGAHDYTFTRKRRTRKNTMHDR